MSVLLKNIIRFILFILIQAFVLDKIPPIHEFVNPTIFFLFILWLPFSISRVALLVISFFFGMTMDLFSGTIGMHTTVCVLIGYLRPFLLNILLPREKQDVVYTEPGRKSLGMSQYFTYLLILTFVYHLYFTFIEWMSFGSFGAFLLKTVANTLISLLLAFVAELLFLRKARVASSSY